MYKSIALLLGLIQHSLSLPSPQGPSVVQDPPLVESPRDVGLACYPPDVEPFTPIPATYNYNLCRDAWNKLWDVEKYDEHLYFWTGVMKPAEALHPAVRLGAINNRAGEFASGCSLVIIQSKGLDEMVETSEEMETEGHGKKIEWRAEWGDREKKNTLVDQAEWGDVVMALGDILTCVDKGMAGHKSFGQEESLHAFIYPSGRQTTPFGLIEAPVFMRTVLGKGLVESDVAGVAVA